MLGTAKSISWQVDPADETDFYIMYTGGDFIESEKAGRWVSRGLEGGLAGCWKVG